MADCADGEEVPRDVGIVYLHDLKHTLDRFRGFSMEELNVLYDTFSVRRFSSGQSVVSHASEAKWLVVLLSGRGELSKPGPTGLPLVFDSVAEGDMAGHQEFFDAVGGGPSQHTATLTMTGVVNIVMVCRYDKLLALTSFNSACGMQMLRMVGEAACARLFCPSRVPVRLDLVDLEKHSSERAEIKHSIEQNMQDHVLFQDLNPSQTDALLDAAVLIKFHRGSQIFYQGTQARCVMVLVSGQLEVRGATGDYVCTLSKAGEVVGEALLPLVVHKGDTFALSQVTMLAFDMVTIKKINDTHPEVGAKLVRNAVKATLSKMRRMFRAGGTVYDSERPDTSKLEKELVQLREVATGGLQRTLQAANEALMGSASIQETRDYAGESALSKLEEVIRQLADKVARKEDEMRQMVPQSELKKAHVALEQHRQLELDLRRENREQVKQIEALNVKLADWQQKHQELEEAAAEREAELQELEDMLAKERDMGRQLAKRMRDLRAQESAASEGVGSERRATMGGGDESMWRMMIKQQQENAESQKQELLQSRALVSELQYQVRNLTAQAARAEKLAERAKAEAAEEEEGGGFAFLEDGDYEMLEQNHADNVFTLKDKLQEMTTANMVLKWNTLVGRIQARWQVRSILLEYVSNSREKDATMQHEVATLHAQMATLQDEHTNEHRSQEEASTPTGKLKSVSMKERAGGSYKVDQLTDTVSRLEHGLGTLSWMTCWLVVKVYQAETAAGRLILPWTNPVVQQLDKCWEVMWTHKTFTEEARSLDMDTLLRDRSVQLRKPTLKAAMNPTPCVPKQQVDGEGTSEEGEGVHTGSHITWSDKPGGPEQGQQLHQSMPGPLRHTTGVGQALASQQKAFLDGKLILRDRTQSLTLSQSALRAPALSRTNPRTNARANDGGRRTLRQPDSSNPRSSTLRSSVHLPRHSAWQEDGDSRNLQSDASASAQVERLSTMATMRRRQTLGNIGCMADDHGRYHL